MFSHITILIQFLIYYHIFQQRHMKKHQDNGEFICLICSYKLKDKETYKTHIQEHKNAKGRLQCLICNKTYPEKSRGFRKHVQTHV